MTKEQFKYYVYCDLYRSIGKTSRKNLISNLLFDRNPGFKYMFIFRLTKYYKNKKNILGKVFSYYLRKLQIRYGIEIPVETEIGYGMVIPHFGGIVINSNAKIGNNATILQGVTIGNNLFKDRNGLANIGDNVTIGAGVKIIGDIIIGSNVTIGANSVVNKNFPDSCVIAGNPANIISYKNSIVLNSNYSSYNNFINNI